QVTAALTWQQLRDIDLTELDDAAEGWAAVSRHADAAQDRVKADMDGALSKTQESESARAAVKRFKRLGANYDYIKTEAGLIRTAVAGLSAELAPYQRTVKGALADAQDLSYTVHTDGSVSYPAAGKNELTDEPIPGGKVVGSDGLIGPGGEGLYRPSEDGLYQPGGGRQSGLTHPNPHHAKAQEIADRIVRALRQARETDERYRNVLSKLKAGPGLTVDEHTWADAAADVEAVRGAAYEYLRSEIPLDKSPVDRKEWWDNLTDAQRQEYLASYPDVIGNLDGIPAAVRHEANKENLQLLIAKLEGEDGEQAEARLGGIKKIASALEENATKRISDPQEPEMFLLGIADEGTGRAIVSYGDPDNSKN